MYTYKSQPSPQTEATSSPIESRAGRRAWTITGLLVVLYMINMADKVSLGIIAQPLSEELNLTAAQIGLVGSLFFIPFTIGGVLAGTVARFVALRWALAGLAALWALTMLPMVLFAGFAVLMISRMLLGLAEGPATALIYTANYSWHPPSKRGLPGAAVNSATSLANLLIAPVLAFLTVTYGWRVALIAMALVGLVWCVLWLLRWSDGPFIANRGGTNGATEEPAAPWIAILTTRTFITVALVGMSVNMVMAVMMTWLPSYFELGLGYTRLQAGSMIAFPAIAGLAMTFLMAIVGDRLTSRGTSSRVARVFVPGAAVFASGLLLAALLVLDIPVLAVLAVTLAFGLVSCGAPLIIAGLSDICPPRQIAGTLGVFTAVFGLGGVIGPYAAGLIVDSAVNPGEGFATAFGLCGVLASSFAALAMFSADPDRDRRLLQSRTTLPQ